MEIKNARLWVKQANCFDFLKEIPDQSVDLIFCDPPFGLKETGFDQNHYNRDQSYVLQGYQEAPSEYDYQTWVEMWIKDFDRILKPNGAIMIVSGWTNEADIQYAFRKLKQFKLVNHLIWQFNFGVYTKTKFVTSHYHILYYCKTKGKPYFNKNAYHNEDHQNPKGGSMVYDDLQDVIKINKVYQNGKVKNTNTLPIQLVEKLIKHTTKVDDVVLDLFSGGFTTQFAALKLKRIAWGCEINPLSCKTYFPLLANFDDVYQSEIDLIGYPKSDRLANQSKVLDAKTKQAIYDYYCQQVGTKSQKINLTCQKFQRGKWSIMKVIKNFHHN